MRHSSVLLLGILCCFLSSVLGSYDGGYGATHDHDDYEPSYAAPPIVHSPHGHHGHSAGSYYHYHVPLVGQQQQHYQPYHHQSDHSQYLWPLLLLLALPLLFLPLLPLLLLPIGLSLLALLMPGGMMMMMMMMMMGGDMMRVRGDNVSGRAIDEMRTFGEVVFTDMTSLFTKYARSLDLDQCPHRIACELGTIFYPENNLTDTGTAKAFTEFVMDQYIPKGKVKRTLKQFEKAFWSGSSHGSCAAFHCQPSFRIYQNSPVSQEAVKQRVAEGNITKSSFHIQSTKVHGGTKVESVQQPERKESFVKYVYPKTHANLNMKQELTTESIKPKSKRSHILRYGSMSRPKIQGNEIQSFTDYNDKYFGMFGTPTVKS
ncbi:unnamed protein product [Orchesella dallaii]|uniref:Uncharacterized protein n=1 Tax=Orchesella dallaii TaxID=48710 RepID=A0ABP1QGZ1_9HEXA